MITGLSWSRNESRPTGSERSRPFAPELWDRLAVDGEQHFGESAELTRGDREDQLVEHCEVGERSPAPSRNAGFMSTMIQWSWG